MIFKAGGLRWLFGVVGAFVLVTKTAHAAPENAPADVTPPSITHVRVAEVPKNKDFVIQANIEDESPVFGAAVYLRTAGTDRYTSIKMLEISLGRFEAVVPAPKAEGVLEYFIEAFDEMGNGPSRAGRPEAPFQIRTYDPATQPLPELQESLGPSPTANMEPTQSPPAEVLSGSGVSEETDRDGGGLETKWWFWTLIGVAVVGAGAAGVFLLAEESPRDTVTVRVSGPDPAEGL